MEYHQDSYHHPQYYQFPLSKRLDIGKSASASGSMGQVQITNVDVVRSSKSFANISTSRFINLLFANYSIICKSTNTPRNCKNKSWIAKWASSLLADKVMLIIVLVTILMAMVASTDGVPVPPIRSSRSLINGGGININNNRGGGSFNNQNPSVASPSSPKSSSSSSSLQTLHGLDSGSSLSIVSPLDILRQNLVMEIMRRKHRKNQQRQVQLNKEILDRIG